MTMRPKQTPKARHDDLFRARLDQIINMRHALVILADIQAKLAERLQLALRRQNKLLLRILLNVTASMDFR